MRQGETAATATLPHRCFTADEYHRMGEAGILRDDDRVELIDGQIVEMAAIGDRHVSRVIELNAIFASRVGQRAWVSVQNPLRLSKQSEPQPDLVLMRRASDKGVTGAPHPEDVLLLIEVADTTLPYDRDTKLPLYAAAGIPEVWILDLAGDRLRVYREPDGLDYRRADILLRDATVSPLAFPDLELTVEEILG